MLILVSWVWNDESVRILEILTEGKTNRIQAARFMARNFGQFEQIDGVGF